MIKGVMNKSIFHNNKTQTVNLKIKSVFLHEYPNIKKNVNINKLLNKVKLEKKSEKQKIILRSLGTLLLLVSVGFMSLIG